MTLDARFDYEVTADAEAALADFRLPAELGFARVHAPVMFECTYSAGRWREGRLIPFGPISVLPNARSIQFGEMVFEGMKAYRCSANDRPHLFRPLDHCRRMAASAERIGMPVVPPELFLGGISAVVGTCSSIIPTEDQASLYLRPFVLSDEAGYSVTNSTTYRFMVLASPTGPYASGHMRAMIERDDVRAARGGTGAAKTGGNYAAALRSTSRAVREGFSIALWLDPIRRECIEEFSGMNLFALVDGELHTPELSDSILAGITRDSIIALARSRGLTVRERVMPVAELLESISTGRCREVFATGTAAIVASITEIAEVGGTVHRLSDTTVAQDLRAALLAIQTRQAPDPFGWTADLVATAARAPEPPAAGAPARHLSEGWA